MERIRNVEDNFGRKNGSWGCGDIERYREGERTGREVRERERKRGKRERKKGEREFLYVDCLKKVLSPFRSRWRLYLRTQ